MAPTLQPGSSLQSFSQGLWDIHHDDDELKARNRYCTLKRVAAPRVQVEDQPQLIRFASRGETPEQARTMDPKWKALNSTPVTDAEAASILREFVRKSSGISTTGATSSSAQSNKKNVDKDIRKLCHAVEAVAVAQNKP